jgi:hypothetical protein
MTTLQTTNGPERSPAMSDLNRNDGEWIYNVIAFVVIPLVAIFVNL